MLKYHLYEKRDGGIINKIQTENGEIIATPKEVNEQLAKTIEEIQIDKRWNFLEEKPFPKLSRLSAKEVQNLIEGFSTNKAITLDGLSDVMFKKEHIKRTSEIFRDLWSIDLNQIQVIKSSFTSRLIPLNKIFPNIPNRKQMRPILVTTKTH